MNRNLAFIVILAVSIGAIGIATAHETPIVQERVVELPQDQQKWYLTVIVIDGHRVAGVLRAWFHRHEHLRRLRSQCHFNVYTATSKLYRDRYAQHVKGAPAILLQKANGAVVYEASGTAIPLTADNLWAEMRRGILQRLRNRQRQQCPWCPPQPKPKPKPEPEPQPEPDPTPVWTGPPEVPDVPAEERPPWWLLALLGLGGAGWGTGQEWKQNREQ